MDISLQNFLIEKKYTKIKLKLTKTNHNMETKMSKKNKVKIGKWNHDKLVLVLFNMAHVNTALVNHNSKPVDGIIGADILKKGKAIIDYEKKYLYLKL